MWCPPCVPSLSWNRGRTKQEDAAQRPVGMASASRQPARFPLPHHSEAGCTHESGLGAELLPARPPDMGEGRRQGAGPSVSPAHAR